MKTVKQLLCILCAVSFLLAAGCSSATVPEDTATAAPNGSAAVAGNSSTSAGSADSALPPCPVNLTEDYMNVNMEVYAYIVIPGTNISYPVVQSRRDDNYYLRRNWKGNADTYGSIFSQTCNTTEFTDPVTVLYGHNTQKGNMLSQLLYYKDEQFFNENNLIYIYLPYGTLVYRIFSAHTFDDRHILNSYNFSDSAVLIDFQQMLLNPPVVEKNVAADVQLNPANHILTLSTCAKPVSGCNERYLVNGVLVNYVFED